MAVVQALKVPRNWSGKFRAVLEVDTAIENHANAKCIEPFLVSSTLMLIFRLMAWNYTNVVEFISFLNVSRLQRTFKQIMKAKFISKLFSSKIIMVIYEQFFFKNKCIHNLWLKAKVTVKRCSRKRKRR